MNKYTVQQLTIGGAEFEGVVLAGTKESAVQFLQQYKDWAIDGLTYDELIKKISACTILCDYKVDTFLFTVD